MSLLEVYTINPHALVGISDLDKAWSGIIEQQSMTSDESETLRLIYGHLPLAIGGVLGRYPVNRREFVGDVIERYHRGESKIPVWVTVPTPIGPVEVIRFLKEHHYSLWYQGRRIDHPPKFPMDEIGGFEWSEDWVGDPRPVEYALYLRQLFLADDYQDKQVGQSLLRWLIARTLERKQTKLFAINETIYPRALNVVSHYLKHGTERIWIQRDLKWFPVDNMADLRCRIRKFWIKVPGVILAVEIKEDGRFEANNYNAEQSQLFERLFDNGRPRMFIDQRGRHRLTFEVTDGYRFKVMDPIEVDAETGDPRLYVLQFTYSPIHIRGDIGG